MKKWHTQTHRHDKKKEMHYGKMRMGWRNELKENINIQESKENVKRVGKKWW